MDKLRMPVQSGDVIQEYGSKEDPSPFPYQVLVEMDPYAETPSTRQYHLRFRVLCLEAWEKLPGVAFVKGQASYEVLVRKGQAFSWKEVEPHLFALVAQIYGVPLEGLEIRRYFNAPPSDLDIL